MKFLCISCDEAMKIQTAAPPDEGGSISALFACQSCGHQIAMLTNPYETQLVQSLGVRIGPKTASAAAGPPAAGSPAAGSPAAGSPAVGMPTAGSISEAAEAGGCPFSGMLAQMEQAPTDGVRWTAEALARLDNIPEFVRPMAKQGIEHYARTHGHHTVDDALMEEARGRFGM